jgi:hypothetical protein
MLPESGGSMGLGAPVPPQPPHHDWPDEPPDPLDQTDEPGEPDEDWPGDWPDDDQPAAAGTPPPPGRAGAGGPPGRPRPLAVAAIAVAALAAGAGIMLAATRGAPSAPATPTSPPSAGSPYGVPGGSGGGALPGSGGGTGSAEQIFIGGKVLAVSATSITIGGPSRSITAAVTSSTHITGQVAGISGVKVGDLVTAQITENGGRAAATEIQDPAQMPGGGSLP